MSTEMTKTDCQVALEAFGASLSRRGERSRNDGKFLDALHYVSVHNITWRALSGRWH
ncbi:MAG: hypothetical protein KGJ78_01240 [Alphaproteobacteria bacterium]|nr:hypothetical protein [Alphaproteobacteria bacterium]